MNTLRRLALACIAAWLTLVLSTGFSQGTDADVGRPRRVALMNLSCDDNLHRSAMAGVDFAAALQAQMSPVVGVEWVERAELEKVEHEFKLAGFGLVNRAESIRGGRWVKADWAVAGGISTNVVGGRVVLLEVVDLQRADLLAETTVPLTAMAGGPFKASSADLDNTAKAIRTILEEARRKEAGQSGRPVLACLFLARSGETWLSLEPEFRRALSAASTDTARFRLLQFQRAAEATDEANLVLTGLAESDPHAWEKVADYYIWGTYSPQSIKSFDRQTRQWRDERRIQISLELCNALGESKSFALTITNEASATVIAELMAQTVRPHLRRDNGGSRTDGARRRISDALVQAALGQLNPRRGASWTSGVNFYLSEQTGRQAWLGVVQALEAACFFDPGNDVAREWWARVRWGSSRGQVGSTGFFPARRRSEVWRKHVEQFGFRSAIGSWPDRWTATNSLAFEYVYSAWRCLEMFNYSQYNQATWGVPLDAGDPELVAWVRELGDDFFTRLLAAPDEAEIRAASREFFYAVLKTDRRNELVIRNPGRRTQLMEFLWPRVLGLQAERPSKLDDAILYPLGLHFTQIGQPGGERKLLAEYEAASPQLQPQPNANPALQQSEMPKVKQVKLPRIAVLDPAEKEDLFALPSLVVTPPVKSPEGRAVGFEEAVSEIKDMTFHQGKLWLAVDSQEDAPAIGSSRLERELAPTRVSAVRLWVLDPALGVAKRVAGPPAGTRPSGLLSHGEELWLALADGGVAAWSPGPGEVRRYGKAEDLSSPDQFALADSSFGIVTLGGVSEFSILKAGATVWQPVDVDRKGVANAMGGTLRRIAASKDWVLLYHNALLAGNLNSNTWERFDQRLSTNAPLHGGLARVFCLAGDPQGGFWVGSDSGLHYLNPTTGELRSQYLSRPITIKTGRPVMTIVQDLRKHMDARRELAAARAQGKAIANPFEPRSRLPGRVRALAADEDFLWVATAVDRDPRSLCLLLYHPASGRWVGGYEFPGAEPRLVAGGGKVWLGYRTSSWEIRSFDKKKLLGTPHEGWLSDEASSADLSAQIESLSSHQQAICRFFWGDERAAVKLLIEDNAAEPSSESLFLLAAAHDANGLNQPADAERYAGQLVAEFRENPFGTCIFSAQGMRRAAATGPVRVPNPRRSTPAQAQPFSGGGGVSKPVP